VKQFQLFFYVLQVTPSSLSRDQGLYGKSQNHYNFRAKRYGNSYPNSVESGSNTSKPNSEPSPSKIRGSSFGDASKSKSTPGRQTNKYMNFQSICLLTTCLVFHNVSCRHLHPPLNVAMVLDCLC
jgi:hypothetical protein